MLNALPRPNGRALAVLVVAAAIVPLTATPAEATAPRLAVPYATPAWARPAADRGAAPSGSTVEFEVGLTLQDGAEAFATAVSTPGSAQYGRFLSPSAWIARFAPTQQTFDAAVQGLKTANLTVTDSPASREYIIGTGSALAVEHFFRTSLHRYAVGGRTRTAATTRPTLPAAIADTVARVSFDRPVFTSSAVPAAKRGSSACSDYFGQHRIPIPAAYRKRTASTPLCGYTPKQLRSLYHLDTTGGRGEGQTIALLGAYDAPSMRRDLATFSSRNHLPQADYRRLVAADQQHQDLCFPGGWQIEQALDLEAAHSVAPRATLLYVGARDCGFGMDLALSRVLDDGLASIVSNSWGSLGEDPNADAIHVPQHLQAVGEGVGLYFASGDLGDAAVFTGMPMTGFPASSPWVTAVGGTAAALDRSGHLRWTTGWGDDVDLSTGKRWEDPLPGAFFGGSGGGASTEFGAPAYQRGLVPRWVSGGRRAVPDVAALASPETGFRVGLRPTGTSRYVTAAMGGTSLATPIVAAQAALAQQQRHRILGFLNPALYRLAATQPRAVRDVAPSKARRFVAVRSGSSIALITLDRDGSLRLRTGYDVVTGVGELTGTSLARLARLGSGY